jgi:hypothetical protein
MDKVPTYDQFVAAEQYALKMMCERGVPDRYGVYSYTKWDPATQKCLITSHGCHPNYNNPFTQLPLTASGEFRDFEDGKSSFHDVWKYVKPSFFVNKITDNSGGMAVCSRGISAIYQWCEAPNTRLKDGKPIPGLTNEKKFEYTIQKGKESCLIPKEYCNDHAYDYDPYKFECVEPVGLQAADFFGVKNFAQGVQTGRMSDSRLKDNIQIHTRDYVRPGIHLYTFRWKPWVIELYGKYGDDIGFIADELPEEWTVIDGHGYRNINLESPDPDMKKIINFFNRHT